MFTRDFGSFGEIACFEKEDRGDGPRVDARGIADICPTPLARGCQDVRIEFVAGPVLTARPHGRLLRALLNIIRRERARTLAEDDDKRTIHAPIVFRIAPRPIVRNQLIVAGRQQKRACWKKWPGVAPVMARKSRMKWD
jgi:hypothetical protein